MNQKIQLRTTESDSAKRIDSFLAEMIPDCSRSSIQKAIKKGNVEYGGIKCLSPKTKIAAEKDITIEIPESSESELPSPNPIPIDILYEDNAVLAINKAAGMVVHPGDGRENDTVVNALLARFANFADSFEDKTRPGIVHRLDKDTSGCLIIAKEQQILEKLIESFKDHKVKKIYLALVNGHLKTKKGTISKPIGRHPAKRKKMAVTDTGKDAITHYTVIKEGYIDNNPISLLKVNIETGRTHQIRVHLASIHNPVIGDKVYGGQHKIAASRQMLHAHIIEFPHPETEEIKMIEAPIPEDIQELIDIMEENQ